MKMQEDQVLVTREKYNQQKLLTDPTLAHSIRGVIDNLARNISSRDRSFKSCNAVVQAVDDTDRTYTYLISSDGSHLTVKNEEGYDNADRALIQPVEVFEDFFRDIVTEFDLKSAVVATARVSLPDRADDINNARLITNKQESK